MAAIAAAALALGIGISASAAAGGGTVVYQVRPIVKLAIPASAATPGGFPFTPSECVAQFGLACYGPQDFRTGYDVPTADVGAGQTIVIVDAYGSPTIRQDLDIYDQEFDLPAANLNIIYPGGSPTFNPMQNHSEVSWAEETSLDVEQVHGLAPAATIDLVVAANNGGDVLNNAENYAVSHKLGNVMSMSFGVPEAVINGNKAQQAQAHSIYAAAAAQGMSVFASSGDSGATSGTDSISAGFPASDPLITSVGGTNLFLGDDGSYQSENVWNDATDCPFGCTAGQFGATGGAPSNLFPAPAYQSGVTGQANRTTSDVSFNASVYTATMIYLGFLGANNGFYFFGGTSEGSPSWAAITAIADSAIGHPLGQLNPLLYRISGTRAYRSDFHDVTVGDNAFGGPGFPAGRGYDIPTGLGSPDVAKLIGSLAAK
ncbi:MAG: S53 family peptidase [Actinobacteria bacterium]|nr:S53 family peptidase [Actinomycetota bacterium]